MNMVNHLLRWLWPQDRQESHVDVMQLGQKGRCRTDMAPDICYRFNHANTEKAAAKTSPPVTA